MTRSLFLLVLVFFAQHLHAQNLPIVIKEGKKYYQYEVSAGQTLGDLEALLQCSTEELLDLNPGLERGVEVGQILDIPVKRGAMYHTTLPKETLYALSRQYEVSVDSLMTWNPSAQNGLVVGQKVLIKNAVLPFNPNQPKPNQLLPAPKQTFSHKLTDTLILHTVADNETLYSISKRFMISTDSLMKLNNLSSSKVRPGQQLQIPIKQERKLPVEIQAIPSPLPKVSSGAFDFPVAKKDTYKIAVFLPFQLDSLSGYNRFVAAAALDYYMGMKLALDSLRKLGFKAEVLVYDEQSAKPTLAALLASNELADIDLIFSPLQEKQAAEVAAFAKKQHIPLVFPVHLPDQITQQGPKFITYTPSEDILIQQLAAELHVQFQEATIVLINSPLAQDQNAEQQFIKAFQEPSSAQSKLKLQQASWSTYKKFKSIGGPLVYVSLSSDRVKVQELLQFCSTDSSLIVAGCKDWLDWKEISKNPALNASFIVAVPSYFSYQAHSTIPLHKLYRRKYSADLTKLACLGYDVTFLIGQQLLGNVEQQQGYISKMRLQNRANGLGIENTIAPVVLYKNGEFIEINGQ
jgi:LysM repeat protein